MKYVNCKKYAQEILDEVKAIPNKKGLVIITVGGDEASKSYVKGKMKDCEYCGIPVQHIKIEDNILASDMLLDTIQNANEDDDVAGIILQLPLPESLGDVNYCDCIVPWKDVDGLNTDSFYEPCTPKGIMYLLEKELGDLTGKSALVIGRSDLVGKPLAKMLLDADCTVTVAHSKTNKFDLKRALEWSDIVISAVGKPKFINLKHCDSDAIVVDVGINRDVNGKLCGDCYDFDQYYHYFGKMKVTPVPGGVGLLTRAMLMKNVADASKVDFD
jgi:methylenetetrahydrofolate dehydrogenase (NADP+)/methenyltetrahydrofolate cyclohydrolase